MLIWVWLAPPFRPSFWSLHYICHTPVAVMIKWVWLDILYLMDILYVVLIDDHWCSSTHLDECVSLVDWTIPSAALDVIHHQHSRVEAEGVCW